MPRFNNSQTWDPQRYFFISLQQSINFCFTEADCIPLQEMATYSYLGDRSHTIKGENCLVWKEVYDRTVKNLSSEPDKLQEYLSNTVKVEEVMLHSKCRRFDLPPEHPLKSALKISNSGPWCYVKRKGNIVAEKCFNVCKGAPREEKTSADRTQYGAREVLKNYNDLLIENIRKYYKSYSWGDVSYYRWKPSDSAFSAEYFRVREQIFYGCVITVVVLILWLLMCSYLRREAAASRRRREEALKVENLQMKTDLKSASRAA
ncbi:hypothetical protein Y032_0025g1229 [Ancylostoma ceylanicum]|uniref:Kringle domain-containing protein n=1 Tax=Ancylostoma ceylanicum TaxID=53326 RepID=A0A016UVI4_9BILA|nr:hypothetical protein Y032_0025g1229 [Ancylostoma ceylanicum]